MKTNQLAERIRTTRISMGLRQEDVAKLLGLSRTSVINIEAGRQGVSCETLVGICKLWALSADYLLGLDSVETRAHAITLDMRAQAAATLKLANEAMNKLNRALDRAGT